jgi:hypothetical protein
MQGYFDKIKGSALKAVQQATQQVSIISSNTINTIRAASTQNKDGNLKQTHPTLNIPSHITSPEDKLVYHFTSACEIMDQIGEIDDQTVSEVNRLLYSSKAKDHLKAMTALLKEESEQSYSCISELSEPDVSTLPCITTLLQTHVLHALCNRACRDLPKGSLPLILSTIASMLRNVRYPLLPHQTVHKPIAHLVTVAWRFEAFHGDYSRSTESKADAASYRRRIG